MRYQGGKSRIATPLAQILNATGGGACFVSLFCGSCSVESKVTGYDRIILNDKHKYLIALLRGVQAGYELPDITRDKIRELMGGSLLHRAFCKEYNTGLGCLGKRGKQV